MGGVFVKNPLLLFCNKKLQLFQGRVSVLFVVIEGFASPLLVEHTIGHPRGISEHLWTLYELAQGHLRLPKIWAILWESQGIPPMNLTIKDCPVWITYVTKSEAEEWNRAEGLGHYDDDYLYTKGYYWAVCQPGCIPDSEFYGPFVSESEAESDAEEVLSY